jgi:hypothetical protein
MQQAPDVAPAAHNPIIVDSANVDLNVGLIDDGPNPFLDADILDLNMEVVLEENAISLI